MSFIPVIKAEISALFQSLVSHDPSEIIIYAARETFLIISVVFAA